MENSKHNTWIGDLKQYWFVISELTGREVKRRYARSYLGIIWSVLRPLLYMLVMTTIFSTMFKRNIENFPIYYLTGYLLYSMYSTITNGTMSVLVDNKNMLMRVRVPKNVFILSRCYTGVINYLYSLIAYFPLVIILGKRVSVTMLLYPFVAVMCILFSLGMGYILSVLYVFFGDIKYLYSVFMTILMYMSALFYPIERVPAPVQLVIRNNPIYCFSHIAHQCMAYAKVAETEYWIKGALWSISMFLLGYLIFRRKENEVMQHI